MSTYKAPAYPEQEEEFTPMEVVLFAADVVGQLDYVFAEPSIGFAS